MSRKYAKYHITKIEEMVMTYINGNRSDFKQWLKKTKKSNIPLVIDALNSMNEDGVDVVYRYLTT